MFASTKKLLQKAQRGKYAVPHFNINNLEIMEGVLHAAVKLRSPIILATSEGAIEYAHIKEFVALAKAASEEHKIPIAFHLDHGQDMKIIKQAIKMGYSSVMVDGSYLPFEENVRKTKKVVQLAHAKKISVEGELGTIGGKEDTVAAKNILYTDPIKAKEFATRTGCDFLAVAIGTSHGAYKFKGKASLRIDLLKKIQQQTKIPLVLHGASGVPVNIVKLAEKYGASLKGAEGVPNGQIKKAIQNGICKINTDTDLRLAFDAGIRKVIKTKPAEFDPRQILGPARDLIQKVAEERIKLCGSAGKA